MKFEIFSDFFGRFSKNLFKLPAENFVVCNAAFFQNYRNILIRTLEHLVKGRNPQTHKIFIKSHICVFFEHAAHMLRRNIQKFCHITQSDFPAEILFYIRHNRRNLVYSRIRNTFFLCFILIVQNKLIEKII